MRNLVDIEKLFNVLDVEGKVSLMAALTKISLEERSYSETDIDYFIKINLALIEKFRDQLNVEYGSDIWDITQMLKKLYDEQNEKTPDMWYKYGYGIKE